MPPLSSQKTPERWRSCRCSCHQSKFAPPLSPSLPSIRLCHCHLAPAVSSISPLPIPPIQFYATTFLSLTSHRFCPTSAPSPCVDSRHPSASTSSWTTFSSTLISHLSRPFRCTDYVSVLVTSPPEPLSSGWTWLQRRFRLLRRPTFWRDAATPASLPGRTHNISTIASPACSSTSLTKTPLPNRIMIPPLAY